MCVAPYPLIVSDLRDLISAIALCKYDIDSFAFVGDFLKFLLGSCNISEYDSGNLLTFVDRKGTKLSNRFSMSFAASFPASHPSICTLLCELQIIGLCLT